MVCKILFIGDPHFKVDNLPDAEKFIEQIEIIARRVAPDIIVIGGDLLDTHERLFTPALNKAYDLVDKMRNIALTYVLVGNHDYINNKQFLTENHWMNGLKEWKNVRVIDKTCVAGHSGMKFTFVPYVSAGLFQKALDTVGDEWRESHCIFAHQELYGCRMESCVSVEGDRWAVNNPMIVSGHIHTKQKIGKNIYYPGTPMQHTFGESGNDNSVVVLEFPGPQLEEIILEMPKKEIVTMEIGEIAEDTLVDTGDNHVKLSVEGDYNQFKAFKKTQKYKNLVKTGVKVVFKSNEIRKETGSRRAEMGTGFAEILEKLVYEVKDPYLLQSYEAVVRDRVVQLDEVIFL